MILNGNMIGNKLFDGDDGDNFGYSVSVESGIIIIGARRVKEQEDNGGSAYLYETPQVYTLYDFAELNAHY